MAFSPFDRGRESDAGAASTPQASGAGSLTAFMDRGSSFEGKLSFKDTVRIDGSFQGEIESENTLIVGESGEVQATIRSQIVVVCGEVEGDVFAGRLTGTAVEVTPVREIGEYTFKPGDLTRTLLEDYDEEVRRETPQTLDAPKADAATP